MKRFLYIILLLILTACTSSPLPATNVPTESAFERTKLFAITAEAETQTSGYPANDATFSAILAFKSAGGTAMAATMTAQPTETPVPPSPTITSDSPSCRPEDLKTDTISGPPATGGQFIFGAVLTNISATPCFLQAWPQVLLMDRQDQPLDVDYNYFDASAGDAAAAATRQVQESATTKIGLSPGWSVMLSLIWRNWCGTPVSGGAVIRLTLINNAGVINIPTDIQAFCDYPGFRSYVSISKLAPAIPPLKAKS
jgi:hypothetical protein